jgi:hypothetical protein
VKTEVGWHDDTILLVSLIALVNLYDVLQLFVFVVVDADSTSGC